MMKLLTKLTASSMLSLGFIFFMISASALPDLQQNEEDSNSLRVIEAKETAFAGIAAGTPLFTGGGLLLLGLRRKHRKQISDRLQSTFYRLVEKNKGCISVLLFAKEANITGTEARQYLDIKAQEFNASFDLSNEGGIYYHFYV